MKIKMKTTFQPRHRPKGILCLVFLSVIIGSTLLIGNFILKPFVLQHEKLHEILGVKLAILPIFWVLLGIFGIIYIVLARGFWRAETWALKRYNNVNRAISITLIFYGALVYSDNTVDPIAPIVAQLVSLVYTFAIASYLQTGQVKSYFGKIQSPVTVEGSPF